MQQNTRKIVNILFVLSVVLFNFAEGYSTGAPASSCYNPVPEHANFNELFFQGNILPRGLYMRRCPAYLKVSQTTYSHGVPISVSILSEEGEEGLRGFLLYAEPTDMKVREYRHHIGRFVPRPGSSHVKTMTCNRVSGGMVTHTENSDKFNVTIPWVMDVDRYKGGIRFVATIVENRETFWTDQFSTTVIRVDRKKPPTGRVAGLSPYLTGNVPETPSAPVLPFPTESIPKTPLAPSSLQHIPSQQTAVLSSKSELTGTAQHSMGSDPAAAALVSLINLTGMESPRRATISNDVLNTKESVQAVAPVVSAVSSLSLRERTKPTENRAVAHGQLTRSDSNANRHATRDVGNPNVIIRVNTGRPLQQAPVISSNTEMTGASQNLPQPKPVAAPVVPSVKTTNVEPWRAGAIYDSSASVASSVHSLYDGLNFQERTRQIENPVVTIGHQTAIRPQVSQSGVSDNFQSVNQHVPVVPPVRQEQTNSIPNAKVDNSQQGINSQSIPLSHSNINAQPGSHSPNAPLLLNSEPAVRQQPSLFDSVIGTHLINEAQQRNTPIQNENRMIELDKLVPNNTATIESTSSSLSRQAQPSGLTFVAAEPIHQSRQSSDVKANAVKAESLQPLVVKTSKSNYHAINSQQSLSPPAHVNEPPILSGALLSAGTAETANHMKETAANTANGPGRSASPIRVFSGGPEQHLQINAVKAESLPPLVVKSSKSNNYAINPQQSLSPSANVNEPPIVSGALLSAATAETANHMKESVASTANGSDRSASPIRVFSGGPEQHRQINVQSVDQTSSVSISDKYQNIPSSSAPFNSPHRTISSKNRQAETLSTAGQQRPEQSMFNIGSDVSSTATFYPQSRDALQFVAAPPAQIAVNTGIKEGNALGQGNFAQTVENPVSSGSENINNDPALHLKNTRPPPGSETSIISQNKLVIGSNIMTTKSSQQFTNDIKTQPTYQTRQAAVNNQQQTALPKTNSQASSEPYQLSRGLEVFNFVQPSESPRQSTANIQQTPFVPGADLQTPNEHAHFSRFSKISQAMHTERPSGTQLTNEKQTEFKPEATSHHSPQSPLILQSVRQIESSLTPSAKNHEGRVQTEKRLTESPVFSQHSRQTEQTHAPFANGEQTNLLPGAISLTFSDPSQPLQRQEGSQQVRQTGQLRTFRIGQRQQSALRGTALEKVPETSRSSRQGEMPQSSRQAELSGMPPVIDQQQLVLSRPRPGTISISPRREQAGQLVRQQESPRVPARSSSRDRMQQFQQRRMGGFFGLPSRTRTQRGNLVDRLALQQRSRQSRFNPRNRWARFRPPGF